MRRIALVCTALLVSATSLQAQRAGTFEVGLFANVAYFDVAPRLDQGRAGPGGRLGYFFTDHLALEGEAAWVPLKGPNDIDISFIPLRARLAYNFDAGSGVGFILGGGFVHEMFKRDADFNQSGATGSVGLRLGTGETVSIRIDSYLDYIFTPEDGSNYNLNWGLQPGLSFMFGQQRGIRDKDGDGVPDKVDECKNTPKGDKVDAKGCTIKDSDGDGVLDDTDACPDTPAGDQVDAKGCSLPKDADGDGVTDDKDACANTPAGEQVDDKGCPLPKDTDGDGVNDDADRCPSTPAGVRVDAEGCQILFEAKEKTLILEGVNFETGSSTLTPESQTILNGVAESLVANDEIKVQVSGHTDSRGSNALNKRLSQARASAVRQYLIAHGVAADRLTAVGYGESRPIASNNTAEGRAQNRRVELTRTN